MAQVQPPARPQRAYTPIVAGVVSIAISKIAVAPFERLALAQQIGHFLNPNYKLPNGALLSFTQMIEDEGALSLWTGTVSSIVSNSVYKILSMKLAGLLPNNSRKQKYISSVGAAVVSQALFYPLDLLRTRVQEPHSRYNGMLDAFLTILRSEGATGLYAGFLPAMLAWPLFHALNLMLYDLFTAQRDLTGYEKIAYGVQSGFICQILFHPLYTIKSVAQSGALGTGNSFAGIKLIYNKIVQRSGYGGLYAGLTATLLKLPINHFLVLFFFEFVRTLL